MKNGIFVKSDKLCRPISHLIFITAQYKLYIWIQGVRATTWNVKKSNFVMKKFSTFFTFPELLAAAAYLILGAYHIITCIFGIMKA